MHLPDTVGDPESKNRAQSSPPHQNLLETLKKAQFTIWKTQVLEDVVLMQSGRGKSWQAASYLVSKALEYQHSNATPPPPPQMVFAAGSSAKNQLTILCEKQAEPLAILG